MELRTRAGKPYIVFDLQEITGCSTYIMRERVKPRYQFEKLFGGCTVNVDCVRCRGKYGCVSCAKSNLLAGAFLLVIFLLVSSFWQKHSH